MYIIIVALLIIIGLKHNEITVGLVFVCILSTFITFLLRRYYNSIGLYINGMNVYYKNIAKRNININEIAGIKIIQSYGAGGKYRGFYPLKNRKGEMLYSAILLKTIFDEMYNYQQGDLWFNSNYKRQIICSVIYDKSTIDYLKILNPNIKIIY